MASHDLHSLVGNVDSDESGDDDVASERGRETDTNSQIGLQSRNPSSANDSMILPVEAATSAAAIPGSGTAANITNSSAGVQRAASKKKVIYKKGSGKKGAGTPSSSSSDDDRFGTIGKGAGKQVKLVELSSSSEDEDAVRVESTKKTTTNSEKGKGRNHTGDYNKGRGKTTNSPGVLAARKQRYYMPNQWAPVTPRHNPDFEKPSHPRDEDGVKLGHRRGEWNHWSGEAPTTLNQHDGFIRLNAYLCWS